MARNLSSAALRSINSNETDEVWLSCMHLSSDVWVEDVFLVRNTEDITSNGQIYRKFPFIVSMPDEEAEATAVVDFVAYNVSRDLTELFRSVTGPVSGKMFWVLASQPDTVEVEFVELEIRAFDFDSMTIKGSLVMEPVLDAVFGQRFMSNVNAPGLL